MDLTLRTEDTQLLVIDVQERLAPAMDAVLWARTRANLERLGEAMKLLGVPVVVSEQYPKGLGPTVPDVKEAFTDARFFEKIWFDAAQDPAIRAALEDAKRPKIVVAGIETHICVYQTVRSLAATHTVHVLADAAASRTRESHEIGLGLMRAAGAIVTTTEAVLFDLLQKAGTDAFKAISRLVR